VHSSGGRGNRSAGPHRHILAGRQPPLSIASDQDALRHLGKRLLRVGTGWHWFAARIKSEASDVSDDHLVAQTENVADPAATPGLFASTLFEADEADGDRVSSVVPVLIMAGLQTGPESFSCSRGIRSCDPRNLTRGHEMRPVRARAAA
jgi:hypothetical protein